MISLSHWGMFQEPARSFQLGPQQANNVNAQYSQIASAANTMAGLNYAGLYGPSTRKLD